MYTNDISIFYLTREGSGFASYTLLWGAWLVVSTRFDVRISHQTKLHDTLHCDKKELKLMHIIFTKHDLISRQYNFWKMFVYLVYSCWLFFKMSKKSIYFMHISIAIIK